MPSIYQLDRAGVLLFFAFLSFIGGVISLIKGISFGKWHLAYFFFGAFFFFLFWGIETAL